ncbi:MAG: nucleotidyltransferase domain-containing protein [Kiritimatiellales bacterium]|nr:nucleotidyltransferase domain-containing protein [Kiritimatiellales bacterium]MCF7864005.1 nucleotidyltransferase domain-containing protein [Kiritimatiellales bacterium]
MTPEKLVEELKQACPAGLKSVILYGSAAAGDHAGKQSDYNVLVVTGDLGLGTLNALSKAASAWAKAGNPAPMLFTEERLARATDVFPIELLDIRECHTVLHGEDLVQGLEIDTKNLRLEIEHELRGNLIRLRQSYLLTQGKAKAVADLMTQSLSTFLVLFRASLRLFEAPVPSKKFPALEKLATHLKFDVSVFQTVQGLKDGTKKAKDVAVDELFGNYLKTIECVIDAVDAYINKGE